jgi:hypothetical protein
LLRLPEFPQEATPTEIRSMILLRYDGENNDQAVGLFEVIVWMCAWILFYFNTKTLIHIDPFHWSVDDLPTQRTAGESTRGSGCSDLIDEHEDAWDVCLLTRQEFSGAEMLLNILSPEVSLLRCAVALLC